MLLWVFCIFLTIVTEAIHSIWVVFLLKKIVEVILENREYATHLLVAFGMSVLVGAVLEIIRQKMRYLLYQRSVLRLEDKLISTCFKRRSGGQKAFVLIQNTVNDFCMRQVDLVMECCSVCGISVILGIYICYISISALLLCLIVTGIVLCLMWKSNQKIPDTAKRSNEKMNAVYGEMWNYLRCKEMLPFLQPRVYDKYEERLRENKKEQILLGKYTNTARISMRFGRVGIMLIAIVYFGIHTIRGAFTLPELFAVTMLLPNFAESILRFPNCIARYRELTGIERNLKVFLKNDEPEQAMGSESVGDRVRSIQVSGVKYSYREGEVNCQVENLSVQEGGSIGIFGESGIGKTTLLRIILGELKKDCGKCLVNGQEIEKIDRQEFWRHVLYLSQDPVILPVSLKKNIVMTGNNAEIDEKKYNDSLEKADIVEIAGKVGEKEVDAGSLSNGEIQKICIARCFYTDKEVFILDEATNAMSPNAERDILKNLIEEVTQKNKMLILVSHNPAVIGLCDKSVRIQKTVTNYI